MRRVRCVLGMVGMGSGVLGMVGKVGSGGVGMVGMGSEVLGMLGMRARVVRLRAGVVRRVAQLGRWWS